MIKHEMYSGSMKYREIDFAFIFIEDELRLIPPQDKKDEILHNWIMTPIGNGAYTFSKSLEVTENYLVGKCNENGHTFIFFPKQYSSIGHSNLVLSIALIGYIDCKYDRTSVDRLSFSCPEINCIHPVNQAYNYDFDPSVLYKNGVFSLTTLDFDSTTTQKESFTVDGFDVQVQFSITRKMNSRIGESPISLNSCMLFDFKPTSDYDFLLRLWRIARQFIQYLCYRKNINLSSIDVYSPYSEDSHEKFAEMYILNEDENEELNVLNKGRYIKQQYISGCEGKILNDIANNKLYTRHIPETYKDSKIINAAKFIMITAAFEWEFDRFYPNGIPKKKSRTLAEQQATETLERLIEQSKGELKKKYKFLKKLVKTDSLQAKIIQANKDLDPIISKFGERLYALNDEKLVISEMGERLSNQRNYFAHGVLDKEFIGLALLDLVFLEYNVYALQLKNYGVNDQNIRKAINELFHLNFAI